MILRGTFLMNMYYKPEDTYLHYCDYGLGHELEYVGIPVGVLGIATSDITGVPNKLDSEREAA